MFQVKTIGRSSLIRNTDRVTSVHEWAPHQASGLRFVWTVTGGARFVTTQFQTGEISQPPDCVMHVSLQRFASSKFNHW